MSKNCQKRKKKWHKMSKNGQNSRYIIKNIEKSQKNVKKPLKIAKYGTKYRKTIKNFSILHFGMEAYSVVVIHAFLLALFSLVDLVVSVSTLSS